MGDIVPLAEYPGDTRSVASGDPDCDYLEGRLAKRNVGDLSHPDAQSSICVFIRVHARGFWAAAEARVQVRRDRYRVPDVVVIRGGRPPGRIRNASAPGFTRRKARAL